MVTLEYRQPHTYTCVNDGVCDDKDSSDRCKDCRTAEEEDCRRDEDGDCIIVEGAEPLMPFPNNPPHDYTTKDVNVVVWVAEDAEIEFVAGYWEWDPVLGQNVRKSRDVESTPYIEVDVEIANDIFSRDVSDHRLVLQQQIVMPGYFSGDYTLSSHAVNIASQDPHGPFQGHNWLWRNYYEADITILWTKHSGCDTAFTFDHNGPAPELGFGVTSNWGGCNVTEFSATRAISNLFGARTRMVPSRLSNIANPWENTLSAYDVNIAAYSYAGESGFLRIPRLSSCNWLSPCGSWDGPVGGSGTWVWAGWENARSAEIGWETVADYFEMMP